MSVNVKLDTTVNYEAAGVSVQLSLLSPSSGEPPEFTLSVLDNRSGDRVGFTHQACPVVHDFSRGYTRWLGTKGIRSNRGENQITGTARADLATGQLIQAFRDAVDMVDQRFSNYRESILAPQEYSDVIYEKRDGVAWLMLNRPETYNAKRGITMDEMSRALLDAAGDPAIRVAVISGAGPFGFCTGNDQSYDPELEHDDYRGTADLRYSEVIQQMPQPVIAAVDGYAIGSGNIMAYQCDYTIATSRSRFGQTGPRVGSPAAGWGVACLADRIGQKRAREMWNLCRQYTAQEAYDMGLVNIVVPPEKLWEEVDRWIADIKNVSPVILQMQKLSFNRHDHFIAPDHSPVQDYIPEYFASEECRERRLAFIERRPIDPAKNVPYVDIPVGQALD